MWLEMARLLMAENPSITWIGHATALWKVNGLNVLTDPVFSARTAPVAFAGPQREVPLPLLAG